MKSETMRAFQIVPYFYSLMGHPICIEGQKMKDGCLCVRLGGNLSLFACEDVKKRKF